MSTAPAPAPAAPQPVRTGLVVACLRIGDLRPTVDPLDGTVRRDAMGVGLSAADAAGLELALRIADVWSARVVAVSAGGRSVEPTLREVAALGVDVVRVPIEDGDDPYGYVVELAADERALARSLSAAVARFGVPDLVLCGDRSVDRGTGALPAYLAHELGAAQALGLVSLSPDPDTGGLLAERRLDGGWREQLRVPLPAVCSVEAAGVRLRRASLTGALGAGDRAVPVVGTRAQERGDGSARMAAVHLGATRPFAPRTRVLPAPRDTDPRVRLLTLTGALVTHEPPTVVHPADAAEAADVLLGYLARHGYMPASPTTGTEGPDGPDDRDQPMRGPAAGGGGT